MKIKVLKKLTSIMLVAVMIVTLCPVMPMKKVKAAVNINDPSVFVKQSGRGKCTLASNVMMLRRYALLKGNSNWASITENSTSSTLWVNGIGMKSSYTYAGISVTAWAKDNGFRYMAPQQKEEHIKELLKSHPEGIVLYDYDYPHAVLVTDFSNGKFYCADPAWNTVERVEMARSLVPSVGICEQYWIVNGGTPNINSGSPIQPSNIVSNSYSPNPDDNPMPTVTISTRSNSRATGVAWIQSVLNRVNGNSLSVDGVYGSGTAAAVKNFQSKYGLSADGVVGPATRSKLKDVWDGIKFVDATSISISAGSMEITTGRTKGLSANVAPANASNKNVTWSSSNSGVATVSGGTINAVSSGTATITASTHNGKTAKCMVTVYDPYNIKFVNEDGSLLSEQKVGRGENANPPANPEKTGYSFVKWDGTYQNVKSDATVTAVYKKNIYNVTFKETNGTKIGETQKIPYDEAATAPSEDNLNIPEGYTFTGWSETFDHISSNIDIYPVYKWADEELPVVVMAEDDACQTEYDGSYSLSFKLKNHTDKERRARVMIYMTTEDGKMVAQGETRTVKIPAGEADEGGEIIEDGILDVKDMYIVCEEAADQARVFVLDEYESAVPLAEIKDIPIQAKGYGEWTDKAPEEGDPEYTKRTIYHSKNVNYTTSTTTNSIAGWTLYNTTSVDVGRGDKVHYGNGRSASAPARAGAYRVWAEGIAYQYDPNIHTVPTYNISVSTTGGDTYRSMVRWIQTCLCRYGFGTDIDGVYGYNTAAAVKNFQSANGLSVDGVVGAGTRGCMQNKLNSDPLYNYYYESKQTNKTYYFYQADSTWSDWTEEKIEGDTTLKTGTTKVLVESKDQYRYKIPESEKPESTIAEMKPECKLPEEAMGLAGKDAVVIVFKNKVNQIAEDNVEYIGNTVIGSDGGLNISFVPREEQTYEGTGDYTVVLGVKGTTNYVKVGTIEAPKPVYKVSFVDEDGTEIDTQEIVEGHDAEVPESPNKDGYTFIGWDTGITNIHGDLTVTAQYRKESFTITYVDWENKFIDIKDCEFEDEVELPNDIKAPEGMVFTGWKVTDVAGTEEIETNVTSDDSDDENVDVNEIQLLTVTSDLLCEAQYKPETFTVTFVDWNGKEVISEEVVYGESAISPEVVEAGVTKKETVPEEIEEEIETTTPQGTTKTTKCTMNFVSWGEDVDLSCITTNLIVGAKYEYDETVELPLPTVMTGEYNKTQDVELTCATEDAVIYYTLDGSDPTDVENKEAVKVYDKPIHISKTTKLKYYATKMGMNDSAVGEQWYAINETGNVPTHIVNIYPINVYDDTIIDGYNDFIQDGKKLDVEKLLTGEYESVELEGVYYDYDFEEKWQTGAQTITESLDLYAKYDAKKVDVTYLDEDGTKITTGKVSYGSAVDDSVAPKKDGYRFVGWESEGDPDHVTGDITVKAKYITNDTYAVVKFGRNSYSIMEGTGFKLNAKVTYESNGNSAVGEELRFISSNDNLATVDDEGNVTAIAKGEVTVTIEVLSSGETAECKLIITGNPDTSICLLSNSVYRIEDGYLRNIPIEKNSVSEIKKQINAQNLKFKDNTNIELTDDEMAGTGTRIQLLNEEGGMIDEVVIVIVGDYSGDGIINGKDISGLTRSLLGKETATDEQLRAMDLNGDGYVNNRDAAMLGRYLVGKEKLN